MYTYTRLYDAYTFHKSQHFWSIQVAMPALRVLHCKVLPPKNGTVDGSASVPTELEQAEKEPEPEKDPAEVQALESWRRFDGYLSQTMVLNHSHMGIYGIQYGIYKPRHIWV